MDSLKSVVLGALCIVLICVTGTVCATTHAHDPWQAFARPLFSRLTVDNGLPDSSIAALAQDHDGYVWIGTANGLVRYDGQHFVVLRADVDDPHGLPDGYIRCLLVLSGHRLLVGTNNGGLAVLDTASMRFTRVPLGVAGRERVRVLSLRRARDGGVWVASDLGLDHFDPKTDTAAPGSLLGLPKDYSQRVFDVAQAKDGRLWIGTGRGLFVRDPGKHRFRHVTDPRYLGDDLVWRLYFDSYGRLWVGTDMKGLFVINPDGTHWAPPGLDGSDGLTHGDTVRDFLETGDGRLWISTYGSGVIVCPDKACSHPYTVKAARGDPRTLASNSVRASMLDASGTLWFGTVEGLSFAPLSNGSVLHVSGSAQLAPALMDRAVMSILVDRHQRVWLGLGDGGLVLLNPAQGTARHLALRSGLSRQPVTSIVQTPDGTVWAGGVGVVGFDPATLKPVARIVPLAASRITSLSVEHGGLVISTYTGVYRYDLADRKLTTLWHDNATVRGEALENTHWILAAAGSRWYATNHGLVRQRLGQAGTHLFRHRSGDPLSLPQDFVSMLAWDRVHRRLWAATKGGLVWAHLDATGKPDGFHLIHPRAGVKPITAVVVDAAGNAWATGDDRMMRVDGSSLAAMSLSHRDGLPRGVFVWRAAALGSSGELLFGGTTGLTVVRPGHFAGRVNTGAKLRISGLRINGQAQMPAVLADDALVLAANQRNVTIDFALPDFRAPQSTRYRYRLIGFDKAWHTVPVGTPASAVYTNLPSGHYQLALRAQVAGLHAHVASRQYALSVMPRWYQTWYGLLLQVLIALLIAAVLVYLSLRWARHRQHMLDQLVAQRTLELRDANAKLETLATTDTLTNVRTRRSFMDLARRALDTASAHAQPLSVLLIDLDRFKTINDQHGHLAGDAVLAACAQVLASTCRDSDIVGRYGGEEFVVCTPASTAPAAAGLAQRLRTAVADLRVEHDGKTLSITCSIGVAIGTRSDTKLSALLSRADKALYAAKAAGRNRVEAAASLDAVAGGA